MTQSVILSHPKGIKQPWRAWACLDAHLPLSQMLKLEAVKKKPVLTTEPYQIPATARTPMAWVKQKGGVDGTDSALNG